jgi:diguanylate cyclase (GGDEF)-like protein
VPGEDDYRDADDGQTRTAIVNLADLHGRESARDRHLLVQVQGGQVGQVVTLHGEQWRVGRHQDSELWLPDGGVSRHHARLLWDGQGYVVEDLDSANGTYAQGKRVQRHRLGDGDVLQFGPTAVFRYSVTDADQQAMLQQLYDASVTDPLTGAYNREYLDTRMVAELSYARRHHTELSLLLLDLDHFKRVNDTYGHQAGDATLAQVASSLTADVRIEDLIARFGGEEFAALLRGIDIAAASMAAERYRCRIEQLQISHENQVITVTVSVDCASLACCEAATPEQLMLVADRRLYAAKRGGRNRVVAEG